MRSFLILLLFFINAWNWNTHQDIADSVFYNLPDSPRERVNRSALEDGAIAPDRDFKDFRKHHFPESYDLTLHWLKEASEALHHNNTQQESYALGVASHYITDSFAAPHYVKDIYALHKSYENQASRSYFVVGCSTRQQPFRDILQEGTAEGTTWRSWTASRNPAIPLAATARATRAAHTILLGSLNVSCSKSSTDYIIKPLLNSKRIVTLAILLTGILGVSLSLLRDLRLLSHPEKEKRNSNHQQ